MKTYEKFIFNKKNTADYRNYLNKEGFIHFKGFFDNSETELISTQFKAIYELVSENSIERVLGIPVVYSNNSKRYPVRVPFCNHLIDDFLKLENFDWMKTIHNLMDKSQLRYATSENLGMVCTHYRIGSGEMSKQGWHTDSMRSWYFTTRKDAFYNVGIHLDKVSLEQGGLRVLAGSHNKSLFYRMFKHGYYFDNSEDKNEIAIETEPGDLTIHNGRIWHRVASIENNQADNERRVIYMNLISGKINERNDDSPPPLYMALLPKLTKLFTKN